MRVSLSRFKIKIVLQSLLMKSKSKDKVVLLLNRLLEEKNQLAVQDL